jgi:hypothetical protein
MSNHTTLDHTATVTRLMKAGDKDAVALIEYWQQRAQVAAGFVMEIANIIDSLAPLEGNRTVDAVVEKTNMLLERAVEKLG